MPHIELEAHLPGITGLLEYRKDTGEPIRVLTQIILRGPSTLTEAERELLATVVSHGNQCKFCTTAHAATVDLLLGESETSERVKADIATAPVSEKMKALLTIAALTGKSGRLVTPEVIAKAKAEGATDLEIHDTVLLPPCLACITAMWMGWPPLCPRIAAISPCLPAAWLTMVTAVCHRDMII